MIRRPVLLGLALVLAACSGEQTVSLSARFPMGPPQLKTAFLTRFSSVVTPESSVWPAEAEPLATDLVVTAAVLVDPPAEALDPASLKVIPATLASEGTVAPFERAELWVAPPDAAGTDDARARLVASGAVGSTPSELVWTLEGPSTLAAALRGDLEGQASDKRIALIVRATAPVTIGPGDSLPGGDGEGALLFVLPLRTTP